MWFDVICQIVNLFLFWSKYDISYKVMSVDRVMIIGLFLYDNQNLSIISWYGMQYHVMIYMHWPRRYGPKHGPTFAKMRKNSSPLKW